VLLVAPAARAEDGVQVAEAIGQAPVAGEILGARERARDDALRTCVQQVAAAVVTAAADADQAQLLSEKIYARAVGYVRRFEILEDRREGDTWVTRMRCEVSEAKLDEDLMAAGIAYRRAGMPRVLVLVAERAIDAPRASGWWQEGGDAADVRVLERAFVDRMERSGFTFVDGEALRGAMKLEELGADPTVLQAREAGAKAGADLVVVGRAVAKPSGQIPLDQGTFHSSVADVSARAIRTDTGEVLAGAKFTAPEGKAFDRAAAGRSALAEAGRMLAREMFARVGKVWSREQSGIRRVAMIVRGVDDYGRLAAFKSALVSSVRGVKEVQERSMEDGQAELEVSLAGTAQELATELATRKFPGFTVKVRKVAAAAVEVDLR
jgi:hypothetical protein